MKDVLLFGVGSAITVEFEETCARRGIRIAGWIKNRSGTAYCSEPSRLYLCDVATPDLLGIPFLCPLFTPANRATAASEAERLSLHAAEALIDPTAVHARDFQAGEGSFVNASVTIGAASRLGRHVLINRSASIGHHADIGDFSSIGPGAVIAGEVTIAERTMVGAGAIILPKIVVGAHAVISAGSVVTKNVPPNAIVRGNPAKPVVRS